MWCLKYKLCLFVTKQVEYVMSWMKGLHKIKHKVRKLSGGTEYKADLLCT